ncbi:hypothetical protein BT96DRAFT_819019 [Gymnopus androsaceus JB14]|uniref:Uncharacterized protein n=1 Tax=Gymnopus androsaceus JB14 TaxID=1447944 RepID=A0A6A4HQ04_9AGAR|nr:hypothetical protein BT96DRAFT_819019 [Gymnopus androsaceus JB14]
MPKDSSRPILPTSSSDFALPSSIASTSSVTLEDASFVLHRFRRPSLLAPKATYISETRLHSPLVSSFTHQSSPIKRKALSDDECSEDSPMYREHTGRESSPSSSSENPTPPLAQENSEESEDGGRTAKPYLRTPPRKASSIDSPLVPRRRLSFPVKQPRIINLLAESRPVENEVKSEAAFQRLVASGAELPIQPRTPHISDRGRYPEEACDDEYQREDTPSDDEADDEPFTSYASSMSEPITILRNRTPASSVNGDDLNTMSISESPSFSNMAMDVDMPSVSPSVSSLSSTPINHWRYTPPPITSAVRSNKRKLDDRFDPYPAASKRRAVSPSVNLLRESHSNMGSPKTRNTPRLPIAIPVAVPGSSVNSAASSPTISNSFSNQFPRPVSITSSPTLRASMGLASPILRPLVRGIRRDGDEKEIEGAGEAVGGLSLE